MYAHLMLHFPVRYCPDSGPQIVCSSLLSQPLGYITQARNKKIAENRRIYNFELKVTITSTAKLEIFTYPSILTYVLGAQKNCLIETVLLSTHNICFG